MTTIHTIEDLIRLLDEKPEWVEALRDRLLTRELIELPEKFANFAAATTERLDLMDQRMDGIDRRLDGIDQRLDRIEVSLASICALTPEMGPSEKQTPLPGEQVCYGSTISARTIFRT